MFKKKEEYLLLLSCTLQKSCRQEDSLGLLKMLHNTVVDFDFVCLDASKV